MGAQYYRVPSSPPAIKICKFKCKWKYMYIRIWRNTSPPPPPQPPTEFLAKLGSAVLATLLALEQALPKPPCVVQRLLLTVPSSSCSSWFRWCLVGGVDTGSCCSWRRDATLNFLSSFCTHAKIWLAIALKREDEGKLLGATCNFTA